MRRVGPRVLAAFPRRIVNIHPALLPKFGGQGMFGLRVHEAVLAAGERETGVTVHLVNHEYDRGPILDQARVLVRPGDTPETLQARVLEVEHRFYPEVLRRIASGEIDLDRH
jgi:phosphoribosylglycinamide formyltransferase-1